jgi:predicted HicB family RNase H-like nuclease
MKITDEQIKTHARRYLKVVEWSDEDQVYIGSALPLIGQCCHGGTEESVLRQLNAIVNEWVGHYLREGRSLPPAPAGREYSGRFLLRITPELHRRAALQAEARGESLNQFVSDRLAGVS